MSIKFLCIGDPHFQDSNIKDVEVLIEKLIDQTKKRAPNFVVIMGDILHSNEKISLAPFKKATYLIDRLSEYTNVYLLIGNHDYMNASQFLTDNHAFNSLKKWKNVFIIDEITVHEYSGLKFCFAPYVPTGRFLEALNGSGECWDLCDCIFAHQEFKGCKMGAKISDTGDVWEEDYPLVISGHIHLHQVLNNVFYTGSIMQHGYADEDDKYLWEFNFEINDEETNYTHNSIDLGLKKKKLVNIDYDDFKNFDATKHKNVNLHLNIKGMNEQFKTCRNSKLYKKLVSEGVRITFTSIQSDVPMLKKGISCKNKGYLEIFRELCKDELGEMCEQVISEVE